MTQAQDAPSFGVPHSGNAIPHTPHVDDAGEQFDPLDSLSFVQDEQPLPDPRDDENPYDQFLDADGPSLDDSADMLQRKRRSTKAVSYERKVQGLFAVGVKLTIANPRTVADSAAMLLHGPGIAEKAGDLAAVNPKAAAIIDAITDQTESPTIALAFATMPLVLQVIRNHEPTLETEQQGIRVFKRKGEWVRLKFRVPFKLFKKMRNITEQPNDLTARVMRDQRIKEALAKQGINLVFE